jgi:hypothetical protein
VIVGAGKPLKWLQPVRCKKKLAAYLEERGLADAGDCGLTTAMAWQIEAALRQDNDAFAQRVWGSPWAEVLPTIFARSLHPTISRCASRMSSLSAGSSKLFAK